VEEKKKEEPDYHSLGRVLSHDFDHVKKHLGEKYVSNDGKRIDQHAIMADHPGDKLKEAAEKLDSAKKNTNNKESNKHKDHGKTFPIDWDGPSKVKVVGSDDKQVHVKRVGKDGKEMEGDEHSQSYSHDEWEDEKQSGDALHKQDPKAFGDKKKSFTTLQHDIVREWVGDEYDDEMINSVAEAYEASGNSFDDDVRGFVGMIEDANGPAAQSRQVQHAANDMKDVMEDGSWHKDLEDREVVAILQGIIRSELHNPSSAKTKK
jgi:hypothetical protein